MRFYTNQNQFYCGIDLHARTQNWLEIPLPHDQGTFRTVRATVTAVQPRICWIKAHDRLSQRRFRSSAIILLADLTSNNAVMIKAEPLTRGLYDCYCYLSVITRYR
jgi:hypothetical protein